MKFLLYRLPVAATLLAAVSSAQAPPVAPKVDHREVRHGATVVDDYFWLREKSNPKVVQYLESENAYTAAMTKDLKPFSDALYTEMLARIKQTDLSVPTPRHGYLYYSRTEEGKQYAIPVPPQRIDDGARDGNPPDLNALAARIRSSSAWAA